MVTVAVVPRVRLAPEYVRSFGGEAIALAASCGLVLDAAQSMVVEDMLGVLDDDRFAALEAVVVEPRQNGKGAIFEARELAGVFILGEVTLIHSAHEYATSLEAFYRMQTLLEANDELWAKVRKVRNAHGEQGFDFVSGARLRYRTRTRGGGRGFSADFLGFDEAMYLPEFAHAALIPTLSARANPQVLYGASAVDQEVNEHGIVLSRLRERGLAGEDPSLVYYEWSLPFDHPSEVPDEVAVDEGAWADANPAMGSRISAEHIANEQRTLSARNFAVERLGVGDWPRTDGSSNSAIDPAKWARLEDVKSRMLDPVWLSFDVTPERSRASIGAAGKRADGLDHVEVVDRQEGVGWVVPRLLELVAKHKPAGVVCDAYGPAASLVSELAAAGVEVYAVTTQEHAQACGSLIDAVDQGTLRHLGDAGLASAVRGAAKRPLGDAFAWNRKTSHTDIGPLVVVTLARWKSAEPPVVGGWGAV